MLTLLQTTAECKQEVNLAPSGPAVIARMNLLVVLCASSTSNKVRSFSICFAKTSEQFYVGSYINDLDKIEMLASFCAQYDKLYFKKTSSKIIYFICGKERYAKKVHYWRFITGGADAVVGDLKWAGRSRML